ncbi:hypothetical protein [Bacteroides salyersiae]|uniref:hypothetical protein n=1 Tax=Bacteroides salyersiae TaxID=291644 RepID=UPI002166838B|nr:hypothetical protein [Bacteroides salyersiae]MCS3060082.1 hypothetical protein [Bacteroides salyersiae]UYU40361.1 hypothetical protein KQP71_18725 [Bacteroides salyersiae]
MNKYPSVLLFGHSFNNYTGMGITLTNLFADWPKDKIAAWVDGVEPELCDSIRPCAKYIGCVKKTFTKVAVKKKLSFKDKCRDILREQYHKTGFSELRANVSISEDEFALAKDFNPEIVFCALGNDAAMKRCENLMNKLPNAKLVLYIVDDWVNTKINTRYFASLWRRKYDKDFRHIMDRASGLLSICQYMTDEYKRMYGKTYYPFHNPVDLAEWQALSVQPKYAEDQMSILYVGKINNDTTPCLLDMSKVVEELNAKGGSFVFDIYSPDYNSKAYLFEGKNDIHAFPPIAHEDIPSVMKSYSSLFLPLGFSKQSRSYVRLSMPTKLTEYLASGKPTILYCPKEIALAKYLSDKDCTIMCTMEREDVLREAVSKLQDKNVYNHLVKNSLALAAEHDIHVVRERFKETMCKFYTSLKL